jgi:hypothetical protein
MDRIKYPVGAAEVQTPAYAATINAPIWNNKTMIAPGTLTGGLTLDLVPDAEIENGAKVSVKFTADGTNRTVALGSHVTGASIAVNASKIVEAQFEWDGTTFNSLGTTALN